MARNQELTAQEVMDICASYMNEKNTKYDTDIKYKPYNK